MDDQNDALAPEQVREVETRYAEILDRVAESDARAMVLREPAVRKKAEPLLRSADSLIQLGHQVLLLLAMLRAWWNREYAIPWKTAAAITAALIYFMNPFDIVPDFLPIVGYLDDIAVLSACLRLIQSDLRAYLDFKGIKGADYGL